MPSPIEALRNLKVDGWMQKGRDLKAKLGGETYNKRTLIVGQEFLGGGELEIDPNNYGQILDGIMQEAQDDLRVLASVTWIDALRTGNFSWFEDLAYINQCVDTLESLTVTEWLEGQSQMSESKNLPVLLYDRVWSILFILTEKFSLNDYLSDRLGRADQASVATTLLSLSPKLRVLVYADWDGFDQLMHE